MEKHEKGEAKGRGASLGRVAGGFLRVPSLPYSNLGRLYKQSQFLGRARRKRLAASLRTRPAPNKAN